MAFRGGTKTERDVPDMQRQTEDYALRLEYERIRVDQLADDIAAVKRKIIAERDHRAEWGGPGSMEGHSDSKGHSAKEPMQLTRRQRLVMSKKRPQCDGHNAPRAAVQAIKKKIRLKEENLHRRLLKLGNVETAAKRHRRVINELRQEQVQLKEVYQNLTEELATMRAQMDEALEKASFMCEERDRAFDELTRIHDVVQSEARQHRIDMKEWNKIVREEKQRQEILRVQQGAKQDDNASLRTLIELRNTKAEEMQRMRQLAELTRTKQLEQAEEAENMVEAYYAAFGKLEELTGIDDVNRLVEMFVAVEDENFATFNYIQHLNREIEREEDAFVKICQEHEKYSATMGHTDKTRSRVIRSLESKLAKTLQQHEEHQASKTDYAVQLAQLSDVVDTIFHRAECDQMSGLKGTWSRPEEKKLSASDTALTANIAILHSDSHPMVMPNMSLHSLMRHGFGNMTILHYLGIIEQRAAEIINAFLAFRAAQSSGQGLPSIPPKSATPVVPPARAIASRSAVTPVRILAMPGGGDEDEEPEDNAETPIPRARMREFAVATYRREMEALASRRLNKKESTKSASRMPRIVRGRRGSAGLVDHSMLPKKRVGIRASTANSGTRSTPALGRSK